MKKIIDLIEVIVLLFFILAILSACSKKNISEPEEHISAKLEPEHCYIGTILKISNLDTSANWYSTKIYFPGMEYPARPDSIKDHVIFTHIYYGVVSGPLKVRAGKDSVVFENFKVLEDCPDSVVVKWYNLNPKITEHNARYSDWEGLRNWQAEIKKDTIHFFLDGFCGDECHYWLDFKLKIVEGEDLPRFILFRYFTHDAYSGDHEFLLKRGLIKIQDYNPKGVISGHIFYDNNSYQNGLKFWYDFSRNE